MFSQSTLDLVHMLSGLSVVLPASYHVINTRNHKHSSKHRRRPVHVRCVRWNSDREERSDCRNDHVDSRECIYSGSIFAEREASRRQRLSTQALG